MRFNAVRATAVAATMAAGLTFAGIGAASATGISPITSQVPNVVPGKTWDVCHKHMRCYRHATAPHGPFMVKARGPLGGPGLR